MFKRIGIGIRLRFALAGAMVALMVSATAIYVLYYGFPFVKGSGRLYNLQSEATNNLALLADQKEKELQGWLKERRRDAAIFAGNSMMREAVAGLIEKTRTIETPGMTQKDYYSKVSNLKEYEHVTGFLLDIERIYGEYFELGVIHPESLRVLGSTKSGHVGEIISSHHCVRDAALTGLDALSEVELHRENGGIPLLHICRYIHLEGAGSAVFVMDLNLQQVLTPLLRTGEGLGQAGEALLVDSGQRVLTTLKHPLASGKKALPLKQRIAAESAQRAARGQRGELYAKDYRGIEVLAAYRHINITPKTGWGLVVKRDISELYAPIRRELAFMFMAALMAFFTGVVLSYMFAYRITRPIVSLSEAAEKVAQGDMSARASTVARDETGLLALTFNSMIETISASHSELEHLVKARTLELEKKIDEVSRSEARYSKLFQNMLAAFTYNRVIADEDHRPVDYEVLQANEAFSNFLGIGLNEIVGLRITEVLPAVAGFEFNWIEEFGTIGLNGGEAVYERKLKPYNYWYVVSVYCPEPGYFVAMFENITERKWAEEEIMKINVELDRRVSLRTRELEIANSELEAFAYSVSHDLRAPLRSIHGFTEAFMEDYGSTLEETGQEYLQRVQAGAERMGKLIDDMLVLSRVTRAEARKRLADLSRMVQEIADELSASDPARSVEFTIEPELRAWADSELIRAALYNLISNAWKFTRKTENPKIAFGAVRALDGSLEYYVKDNGAGFDPAYSDKLFGAFQRLHSGKDFEGTGIGLATVQRIIAKHGGQVRAEGAVGQGAAFYFKLQKD